MGQKVPVATQEAADPVSGYPGHQFFRTGRGITLINYTSDQFNGFKNIVVTGTMRDSQVVLEGLLHSPGGVE